MKKNTVETISTISLFLLLEILAFVSFGLSNSIIVFAVLGVVIVALIAIVSIREIKLNSFSNALFFLIPLFVFALISALGPFSGLFNIVERISIPLALLAFSVSGYFVGHNKEFNIHHALLVIYGGLALIVLINLFITMIEYHPFYTLIHANHYVYYDGALSDTSIGNTAYALMGFKFQEVSIEYFTLYPSVLSSSVIALFFVSPKTERRKFVLYAIYAGVGILTLIFTPTKMTLITSVLILIAMVVIIIFGKKYVKTPIFKYIFYGFLALVVVIGIIFVLNAQVFWDFTLPLRNFIENNSILNRLFNANRLSSSYSLIMKYAFGMNTICGFQIDGTEVGVSSSILFDSVTTSGILGLVFIGAALLFSHSNVSFYLKKGKDDLYVKLLILGFIYSFFLYSLVNYDMKPFIRYGDYIPFYKNGLFLIIIFLIGYMYSQTYIEKEVKQVEEKQEEKKEESYEL